MDCITVSIAGLIPAMVSWFTRNGSHEPDLQLRFVKLTRGKSRESLPPDSGRGKIKNLHALWSGCKGTG